MRNRQRDQTSPVRALRLGHIDPGALFELGLLSVAGMLRRLQDLAAPIPRGDELSSLRVPSGLVVSSQRLTQIRAIERRQERIRSI
jgi:hypothetical protein